MHRWRAWRCLGRSGCAILLAPLAAKEGLIRYEADLTIRIRRDAEKAAGGGAPLPACQYVLRRAAQRRPPAIAR